MSGNVWAMIIAALRFSATGPSNYLPASSKSLDQNVELRPLVTGVEAPFITGSQAISGTLFSEYLNIGIQSISMSDPIDATSISVVGAALVKARPNYVVVNVTATGTVTILGVKSITTERLIASDTVYAAPDTTKLGKILQLKPTALWSPSNFVHDLLERAQRVYNYYQQRYVQKVKLYAPSCKPGDIMLVDTYSGKRIVGVVERMESDLSGGFVSKVEIVGVVQ